MPPLEAFRTAVSLMTSRRTSSRGKQLKMAFFEISRARFYGKLDREVHAELPEELKIKYGRDVEAKLKTNELKKDNVTLIINKKFENVDGN